LICNEETYWWFLEDVKGSRSAGLLHIPNVPGWTVPEKVELLSKASREKGYSIDCDPGEPEIDGAD
jgi:hypothetical protein